jgi:CRISPR-associated protein Csd2
MINNRYDFVLLFDVKDGNPNGDPDAGNLPRVDPETGHGIVTDVCIKRKVRNYIQMLKGNARPYEIYVKEKAILNLQHEKAHNELRENDSSFASLKDDQKIDAARLWMCQNFFDIRTFGAVMSTGEKDKKCGQVRGPVQITFARSLDTVIPLEYSITRMAVTTEKEAAEQSGDNRTMGRKFTIPYGLYRAHGFISAHLAKQTQFSEDDLDLLFEALTNMFEHDRSASRGLMQTQGLYVFKHDSELGRAPAHTLFDAIDIRKISPDAVPRSISDYVIDIREEAIPKGVELIRKVECKQPTRV